MVATIHNQSKVNVKKLYEKLNYKPHPVQSQFHASTARFKTPVCGRRMGKSVMAGRDLEPNLLRPNPRFSPTRIYWIVGPVYSLAEKEFRVVWQDLIITLGLGRTKGIKKSFNLKQGNMFIEFPWGVRLETKSADRQDSLVGDSLWSVIMSEAAKHDVETWDKYIRPALADFKGTATFPTTPEGKNWIYDLYLRGQDPNQPDYDSWQFPSWTNPHVYPEGITDPEIIQLRETLPTAVFEQEIAADFTKVAGSIFPDFAEHTHVTDVKFDPSLPNYIAFDFGYVNPFAALEFQLGPQDQVRIWREHYKTHATTYENLQIMAEREQPDGYRIDMCVGDPADPESIATINKVIGNCYGDPAVKDWKTGIDLMTDAIKLRIDDSTDSIDEHGTPPEMFPGFVVDRECRQFIDEMLAYKSPKGTLTTSPKEIGVKKHDHGIDAIRYALFQIFVLGRYEDLDTTMPELLKPRPEDRQLLDITARNDLDQMFGSDPIGPQTYNIEELDSGLYTARGMSDYHGIYGKEF